MPKETLVDLSPGKGLDAGVYPSAEVAAGQVWRDSTNGWFREYDIAHVLGRQKKINIVGRPSGALAQAFNTPIKSLYYETFGFVYQWDGTTSTLLGALNANGDFWFEPWGTWLLLTDNITVPQIWKGAGFIPLGQGQFSRAKIIKKIAQFAVAYNTDVLPNGFHWTDVSDPETWIPSIAGAARNLQIRDLDSDIIAVADLGAAHAVYSSDNMLLVQYVGVNSGWLGTPSQALNGIGAVSKYSVVSVGRLNFGLSRAGIFVTDGTSFTYVDRPAVDRWIQEVIDWSRPLEIAGWWNERLGLVVWNVPTVGGGKRTLALDPKTRSVSNESTVLNRKSFTYLDGTALTGLARDIFEQVIVVQEDGIYFDSIPDTVIGNFELKTQFFDGGAQDHYKLWDYGIFPGRYGSDAQVRFGFSNVPDLAGIEWTDWAQMKFLVPFGPRESIFLAVEFKSTTAFKMTGAKIFGEVAGLVN